MTQTNLIHHTTHDLPLFARLDKFLYIKNGYSVLTHFVPFAVAALLLVTLSVPADNLFLQLVNLLQQPSWVWLPASVLTIVCVVVYVTAMKVQISKAYLSVEGDQRRTIVTSIFYFLLCTLMAYMVLRSTPKSELTLGSIWACGLIAALSLTGIGWSGPSEWVNSVGVESPDYSEGRLAVHKLSKFLDDMTKKATQGDLEDVAEFSRNIELLSSSIEENLHIEPEWLANKLKTASILLRSIISDTEKRFPADDKHSAQSFPSVCRREKDSLYPEFTANLTKLNGYMAEWQPHQPGKQSL